MRIATFVLATLAAASVACGGAGNEDDSGEAAGELAARTLETVTVYPADAPHAETCLLGDHYKVSFVDKKVVTNKCTGGANFAKTERALAASELAQVKSALSTVRKLARARACEPDTKGTLLVVESRGATTNFISKSASCDSPMTPAKDEALANVAAVVRSLADTGNTTPDRPTPPVAGEGALTAASLTIMENLPSIADARVRLLMGPPTGEMALYTMRRGTWHSNLVGALPNLRFMQKYRAWDLRSLGGQLVDYLFDPGLNETYIRVTEGNRTGVFGPFNVPALETADARMTQAELTIGIGPSTEPPPMWWYDGAVARALLTDRRIDEYLVTIGGRRMVVDNAPISLLPDDPRVLSTP